MADFPQLLISVEVSEPSGENQVTHSQASEIDFRTKKKPVLSSGTPAQDLIHAMTVEEQ